ncbi:MAG TPA: glycosyltransferase [Thermoanaerobaculia bacterium]|nr:glycosyltransferase [Thermoanaerobaculia bacterium]
MRVLITNHELLHRGGSQAYVCDLARGLAARGLQPLVFTPHVGAAASELRAAAIPVVDDPARLGEPPDLIHGQHHLPTLTALSAWPGVPAVFFCHGWLPSEEAPPRHPRILRWVAVDRLRRERLVSEEGVDPARVEVLPNFVDLVRFRPRPPLPRRPRKALVFSNQAADGGYLEAVRAACRREGIAVDVVGFASGRTVERVEEVLPAYDLVFARGRSAMEAMAVGAAVVLCDLEGAGPMVTHAEVERLRDANFGIAALTRPPTVRHLGEEIARYDAADATRVRDWVRTHADAERTFDRVVELYREVLAEARSRPAPAAEEESRYAAQYLLRWSRAARDTELLLAVAHAAKSEAEGAFALAEAQRLELRDEQDRLRRRQVDLEAEIAELRSTTALRLRGWLLARPILAAAYRRLRTAGGA